MTTEPSLRTGRRAGVLAHPTSLPGSHGVGDLGTGAYRFVDFLADGGQQLWQVLPLNPPGHGESPYGALSAFAGNPLLISLPLLVDEGLLSSEDLMAAPNFRSDCVDFVAAGAYKRLRLVAAYRRFVESAPPGLRGDFERFRAEMAAWLGDFALFMALKEARGGVAWNEFGPDLARRDSGALAEAQQQLADSIGVHEFAQFLFFRQWNRLKEYANRRGVRVVGDIPIFVAYDSADVWARQELFHLDDSGNAIVVAGVPPDIFSATGQRWGNPLYRWDRIAASGYDWWVQRFRHLLATIDLLRIDHFRGFAAYWEVPASEPTAVRGHWVAGPGAELFRRVGEQLGSLPIIVEDLGLITPDVSALRDELGYPGMTVLQFAFGDDARNPYLPHNYRANCVAYTGTHDNETTRGWFASQPDQIRHRVRLYLGRDGSDIAWDFIRLAWSSVANDAIAPLQDVLDLGNEARMNYPGRSAGNWGWRVTADQLRPEIAARLRDLTATYGRDRASNEPVVFGELPTGYPNLSFGRS
ncbi:MAG: 4-alpha-glucanotransferase [Chloroflexota bacterium]